jgi:hypothetical protein
MPKPFVVLPESRARALDVVGEKITVLASVDDTHGYELFFQDGTKGTGPPPHSHDWDESFFVLRGDIPSFTSQQASNTGSDSNPMRDKCCP